MGHRAHGHHRDAQVPEAARSWNELDRGLGDRTDGPKRRAGRRATGAGSPRRTRRVVASFWQNFGKMLLVFGCIGSDFCKKICVLQHFSKSTRFSSWNFWNLTKFCKFCDICNFFLKFHENCCFFKPIFLLKFWDCSGAKGCKSCRAWKMLSNAYFLAKFRFDTAENEPAKNLQNFRKMHFRKMHFRKMHFSKMHFSKMHFSKILQIFGGLVLGCIKTKFCKKICVRQHFSSSTRFASFCTAAISKF